MGRVEQIAFWIITPAVTIWCAYNLGVYMRFWPHI
jgi:hypothetical protein